MTISFEDFNQRSEEVSKYFDFLQDLQQGKIKLITEGQGNSKAKKIDTELENTLKASGYLLLYNLIESTMKDAIEAIFNKLQNQGVSFDNIKPELKKILLRNLKRRDPDQIFAQIQDISLDIVKIGFKREELFSGNIDARLIRDIASKYGFSADTEYTETSNGGDLLTVKTNRNDLAHGIKSFAEVGKERGADELIKIKDKVVEYLRQILENIQIYIDNQEYLDSTNTP
ncbi:MAE_28990/MAE_18760 family HEPN-like nuclease [Dapis sp. BLCC M126]|uniref:MAE_28990/MAE_18760 family HEPN-like nuclease n=1 Tax=Dapis sp. BLCC M126 TaxID=3400189 RepID=UPI003CEC55DE